MSHVTDLTNQSWQGYSGHLILREKRGPGLSGIVEEIERKIGTERMMIEKRR